MRMAILALRPFLDSDALWYSVRPLYSERIVMNQELGSLLKLAMLIGLAVLAGCGHESPFSESSGDRISRHSDRQYRINGEKPVNFYKKLYFRKDHDDGLFRYLKT